MDFIDGDEVVERIIGMKRIDVVIPCYREEGKGVVMASGGDFRAPILDPSDCETYFNALASSLNGGDIKEMYVALKGVETVQDMYQKMITFLADKFGIACLPAGEEGGMLLIKLDRDRKLISKLSFFKTSAISPARNLLLQAILLAGDKT
jgi:hypothetical protein